MRIGCVAQITGTSVRSLRHYEQERLITPGRHANGYRDFCAGTIDTILQVRSLLDAGLPVRLIREVLPDSESGPVTAAASGNEFLSRVELYRHRLADRIDELTLQRTALDDYLRRTRTALARRADLTLPPV